MQRLIISLLFLYLIVRSSCGVSTIKALIFEQERSDNLLRALKTCAHNGFTCTSVNIEDDMLSSKLAALKSALAKEKSDKSTMFLVADENVVFTQSVDEIIRKLALFPSSTRILFAPDEHGPVKKMRSRFPLVDSGYRTLNSNLFIGTKTELLKLLEMMEEKLKLGIEEDVAIAEVYVEKEAKEQLGMAIDSNGEIFATLNAGDKSAYIIHHDSNGEGEVRHKCFTKSPGILRADNSIHFDRLIDKILQWNSRKGCKICAKRVEKEGLLEAEKQSEELQPITLALFITEETPFLDHVLDRIAQLAYPKSKVHLFLRNQIEYHQELIELWTQQHMESFASMKVLNSEDELLEADSRVQSIDYARVMETEFIVFIDSTNYIKNPDFLRDLVSKSRFYETGILAPLFRKQNGHPFSNFWGDVSGAGYYQRSEDYVQIIDRHTIGLFRVPHVYPPMIVRTSVLDPSSNIFSLDGDARISFSRWARTKNIHMFLSNEDYGGYLLSTDGFKDIINKGKMHPELWQMAENPTVWESQYLNEDYHALFSSKDIPQPCTDVFDFPLVSPLFCQHIIEEMEHFGEWSNGKNEDKRLAGGYENVPTRDIHMKQIGFNTEWLAFMEKYVRPVQRAVFAGYEASVSSSMMFVVRYRADEQPSLRPHNDASTYSIDIALNQKGTDYEGGGVRFVRYNCSVPADVPGHAMMFPGRLTHQHEGLPTTNGTRYILVSFINP